MSRIDGRGPDVELLRTFLAVAEAGNVTHAAAEIALTQSAASLQLQRLEKDLGVVLFHRLPRGVELTASGRALIPAARRAVREVDTILNLFGDPLAGSLRMGIPDDYSGVVLERVLGRFTDRHPGVELQVIAACSASFPSQIQAGDLDIAVYSAPDVTEGQAFFSEPMVWAAHEAFELPADRPVPLALFDRTCWWTAVPTDALDREALPWRVLHSSSSQDGVKAAIRARLAVGILPLSALDDTMVACADLPALPPAALVLLTADDGPSELIDAMGDAIRHGFSLLTNP